MTRKRRTRGSVPSYRKHKPTGQAVVTLNGRDFYLGPHGSRASIQAYDALIAEWTANSRRLPDEALTINELIVLYVDHADRYYRKDDESLRVSQRLGQIEFIPARPPATVTAAARPVPKTAPPDSDRHKPAFPDGPPVNRCLRTEPFPDWERAADLVRAAAPMDVRGPLYCVADSDLPADFNHAVSSSWVCDSSQWWAYTGRGLWSKIGPHLAAAGRWYGPGTCIVFHVQRFAGAAANSSERFQRGLAMLVHEFGHAIDDQANDAVLKNQSLRDTRLARVRANPLFASYATRAPQGDSTHGAPFIRAAFHLWHRTNAIHALDLNHCGIVPKADLYRLALAGELDARRNSPIADILRDEPPRVFLQFWNETLNDTA